MFAEFPVINSSYKKKTFESDFMDVKSGMPQVRYTSIFISMI